MNKGESDSREVKKLLNSLKDYFDTKRSKIEVLSALDDFGKYLIETKSTATFVFKNLRKDD